MSAQPMLERLARTQRALALIERRARLSIVHAETGLARDALRALYREVHGEPAPSGQLPTAVGSAITTRHSQLCASLFARLYRHVLTALGSAQEQDRRWRSTEALIQAHDLARALLGADNSLDITLCWMLARDLRLGSAYLRPCPRCQIQYLITEQGRFDLGCPLCARYRSLGLSSVKVELTGGLCCEDEPSRVRAPRAHPGRETGLAGCGERTR